MADNPPATQIPSHPRFRLDYLTSSESFMASEFEILLRESELLQEVDIEVGGVDATMMGETTNEKRI